MLTSPRPTAPPSGAPGRHRSARTTLRGRKRHRLLLGALLVVLVGSLLVPAEAAAPRIRFFLDRPAYDIGQTMTLTLKEEVRPHLRVRVRDSQGTVWRKVVKTDRRQVWRATAKQVGTAAVTIVLKRPDGRVFRRAATYTVRATSPSGMPAPVMGVSASSNDHGGTEVWDAWRVYSEGEMFRLANRTGSLRPKALLYSKGGSPLGGTSPVYSTVFNEVLGDLNDFYYTSASGQTHSARWGIDLYWSNGNEMHNKGVLYLPQTAPAGGHTAAQVAGFVTSQRALYDAVHYVDPSTGHRRFPDAHAGSDPTTESERSGWVEEWLHASARWHDFVAWSIYPAGRKDTTSDPTFNFPSTDPADADVAPHGYMVRCFERVKRATLAAGLPMGSIGLHVGETGTGDDPDDPTTRPYWATYGFMEPLMSLSESYRIPLGTVNWWDAQLDAGSPQNILSDEDPTTPSTRQAWQKWRQYDTLRGGTLPSGWPLGPRAVWKTTGT